jgi:hypothetical protein
MLIVVPYFDLKFEKRVRKSLSDLREDMEEIPILVDRRLMKYQMKHPHTDPLEIEKTKLEVMINYSLLADYQFLQIAELIGTIEMNKRILKYIR